MGLGRSLFSTLKSFGELLKGIDDSVRQRGPWDSPRPRVLEWVAIPFSRGSSQPRDQTHVFLCLLHWQVGSSALAPPGKPSNDWIPPRKKVISGARYQAARKYIF